MTTALFGVPIVPVLDGLVTVVGLFVAYQAYRGYRRNDSHPMLYLAVGIALIVGLRFGLEYPLGWLGLVSEVLKQVVDIVALLLIGYALVRP